MDHFHDSRTCCEDHCDYCRPPRLKRFLDDTYAIWYMRLSRWLPFLFRD